ncbi:MAG: hypothetical protein P4L82_14490 [Ancalomicrobiaceae bacterium]|nr:hypothetical protein [Ancalomicrobiaceae bacterium]
MSGNFGTTSAKVSQISPYGTKTRIKIEFWIESKLEKQSVMLSRITRRLICAGVKGVAMHGMPACKQSWSPVCRAHALAIGSP